MLRIAVYGGALALVALFLLTLFVPSYLAHKDLQHIKGLTSLSKGIQAALEAYAGSHLFHQYPENIPNYEALRKIVNNQRGFLPAKQSEAAIANIQYESKNGKGYILIIEGDVNSQSRFRLITPEGVSNFTRVSRKVPPDIKKISNMQIIRFLINIDRNLVNKNINGILDNYATSPKLNISHTIYRNGKKDRKTNFINLGSYKETLKEARTKLSSFSRKREDIYIDPNPQSLAVHSDVVEIGEIDGESYKKEIRELYNIKIVDNRLLIINDKSFAFIYYKE